MKEDTKPKHSKQDEPTNPNALGKNVAESCQRLWLIL